jgi:hypothetical protein
MKVFGVWPEAQNRPLVVFILGVAEIGLNKDGIVETALVTGNSVHHSDFAHVITAIFSLNRYRTKTSSP